MVDAGAQIIDGRCARERGARVETTMPEKTGASPLSRAARSRGAAKLKRSFTKKYGAFVSAFCCLGAIERDCTCLRVHRKYGERVKAKVIVMPKKAVLDPQGNAVRDAMRHLGMPEVRSVRIGKYMEIDVDGQNGDLEAQLHGLCRDLLSNPVIEDYELQRDESGKQEKRNTNTNAKRKMNQ